MTSPLTTVELFAGVGGFRIGLERRLLGFSPDGGWAWEPRPDQPFEVVFGNQWEPSTKRQHAFDAYAARFDDGVHSNRDIAEVLNAARVPAYDGGAPAVGIRCAEGDLPATFDLLVGGFPCQDYSVAKPLSQAAGMGGSKGALWWEIARILQHYRPDHVLLENVDRLLTSPARQRGRDFAVMLACFAQLGYGVEWRVVNAADYGFPQRRRRVFIYATLDPRWQGQFGLAAGERLTDSAEAVRTAGDRATEVLASTGVLQAALPCAFSAAPPVAYDLRLGHDEPDPHAITTEWPAPRQTRWRKAGVMSDGMVWTADVDAIDDPQVARTLGDVLLPVEDVLRQHPDFLIDAEQLGEEGVKGSTWRYLKGAKSEERVKRVDGEVVRTYNYTEGAVAFPEPLDRPSRTILTGEGGRSPSRFKHVVAQPVPGDLLDDDTLPSRARELLTDTDDGPVVYRRLLPVELERLNMFPDGWTAAGAMTDGRRAFCMGNALVVGIVERIGDVIADRARAGAPVPQPQV